MFLGISRILSHRAVKDTLRSTPTPVASDTSLNPLHLFCAAFTQLNKTLLERKPEESFNAKHYLTGRVLA